MRTNILMHDLPEHILDKKIRSDFRNMLLFESILYSDKLDSVKKMQVAMANFYIDPIEPSEFYKCWDALVDFYNSKDMSPKELKTEEENIEPVESKRCIDYEQDQAHIYGAFASVYGIRLTNVSYMHWYEFKTLFQALPDECKIKQIIAWRSTDTSKIKDKKEKARIEKLKQIYAIKDTSVPKTLEERKQAYLDRVNKRYEQMQKHIEEEKQNGGL